MKRDLRRLLDALERLEAMFWAQFGFPDEHKKNRHVQIPISMKVDVR